MNRTGRFSALALFVILSAVLPLAATPTKLVVHVVARDAKLIGTHVGGARVVVRDVRTGRVLAQGIQEGETGDTAKIMKEPRVRGAAIFDTAKAAGFTATLELSEPTRVEISAEGPLKYPQSMEKASTTLHLIPGKDVTGDGVVLELHGLAIELTEPASGAAVQAGDVPVKFHVAMMCGCPIEPGGMWDANAMDLRVRLMKGKRVVQETAASYAGTASDFGATLTNVSRGRYTLEIVGSQPAGANFGHFVRRLDVKR